MLALANLMLTLAITLEGCPLSAAAAGAGAADLPSSPAERMLVLK
jgi:hypothetical protein